MQHSDVTAPRIRAVLFDLDGTLLDTAPDLIAAANQVRREEHCAPLPAQTLRPLVSHGARAMMRCAFPGHNEAEIQILAQRMVAHYQAQIVLHTRLFPGMEAVLRHLEQQKLPWGIVTNKPEFLTTPLLVALGLAARSACTVSGDTLAEQKPHPLPILHACQHIGVSPAACVYVGDAQRDMEAGQRAGTRTAAALFGYIGAEDCPRDWGADWYLHSPTHLWEHLVAATA